MYIYMPHIMMVHFHTPASCHCTLYITLVCFHTSSSCRCTCICTLHCDGPLSHFILMSLHMYMHTAPWWSTFTLHSHVTACVYHITINGPLSHFSLMSQHMCTTSQLKSTLPHSEATCCLLQQTPKRLQQQICKRSVLPLYVEDGAVYKYSFSFF